MAGLNQPKLNPYQSYKIEVSPIDVSPTENILILHSKRKIFHNFWQIFVSYLKKTNVVIHLNIEEFSAFVYFEFHFCFLKKSSIFCSFYL